MQNRGRSGSLDLLVALMAGENVGHDFVVPTVVSCLDLMGSWPRTARGTGGSGRLWRCPGGVEGDVVEAADLVATRAQQLVRAQGFPPHAERFEWAGLDLAALLAQEA